MNKKRNIDQYRERLDRTLASPELNNNETLKILIKKQLDYSSQHETREYGGIFLDKKATEVLNFLYMLRSASSDGNEKPKSSQTAHVAWKLKQDTEEFRVMYRKGPHGSPFHSLLAEGYVDGPVDACLCTSWEPDLYKKWWPQFSFPPFKVISSECVQKIRIGEQIALVRMKVPWPLSTREAAVHYCEFEYFQDDLILVLLNTISDLEAIDKRTHGFTKDVIPEAQDVVRIDVVGGFALQKVTAGRSYFRTIGNLDLKVDFVPSSLINFISRQLIGSGFKLYQKVVSSSYDRDKDFEKALGDPLYTRIRQALYLVDQAKALEQKQLKSDTYDISEKPFVKKLQSDLSVMDEKFQTNDSTRVTERKTFGEIEEERGEEITNMKQDGKDNAGTQGNEIAKKHPTTGVHVSDEVQQALEMLDKAICMIREYRSSGKADSFSKFTDEEPPDIKENVLKDSTSLNIDCIDSKVKSSFEIPNNDTAKRTSQELRTSSGSLNTGRLGSSSYLRDINHNKIAPASPGQNHFASSVCDPVENSNIMNEAMGKLQNLDNHAPRLVEHVRTEDAGMCGNSIKGVQQKSKKKPKLRFLRSIFRG